MRMFTKVAALAAAVAVVSVWAVADGSTSTALTVPLKGLTKDNAAKVETALQKLDRNGYRCATCDYFSATAGDCPGCGTALVAEKAGILLRDVKVDAGKNLAVFGVSGANVRLSEIEGVLPSGVTIDRESLTIQPFTRLTITGITSDEDGAALEKALKESKLFDAVKTHVDVEHEMAVVIVGGATKAPTYEMIEKTIQKGGEFEISEVAWAAACPKCAEKGMTHAGCTSCWERRP